MGNDWDAFRRAVTLVVNHGGRIVDRAHADAKRAFRGVHLSVVDEIAEGVNAGEVQVRGVDHLPRGIRHRQSQAAHPHRSRKRPHRLVVEITAAQDSVKAVRGAIRQHGPGRIIEVPVSHQPRLAPRQPHLQVVDNVLLRADSVPDAKVVKLSAKRFDSRGNLLLPEQEPVRPHLQRRARLGRDPKRHAVDKELRLIVRRVLRQGEVIPGVRLKFRGVREAEGSVFRLNANVFGPLVVDSELVHRRAARRTKNRLRRRQRVQLEPEFHGQLRQPIQGRARQRNFVVHAVKIQAHSGRPHDQVAPRHSIRRLVKEPVLRQGGHERGE